MTAPRNRRRVRPAYLVAAGLSRVVPDLIPAMQKTVIKKAYQLVNWRTGPEIGYLNYGYATIDAPDDPPVGGADPLERYSMQLYGAVVDAVDLFGKDLLEVGCGRGGGSGFLARDRPARSVTGVDFASGATASWAVRGGGARFVLGDAERLPFRSSSFDVVVNIESSHCYPDVERFVREVARVLRQGGHFVFADFRSPPDMDALRVRIGSCGFVIHEDVPISANVVRALELDTARRLEMMRRTVPRFLHGVARDFMGVEGSEIFHKLRGGQLVYNRLTMQKQ